MEYKLLVDMSPGDLQSRVNKLIGEGWAPLGGVSISVEGEFYAHFAQALVRSTELDQLATAIVESQTPAELDQLATAIVQGQTPAGQVRVQGRMAAVYRDPNDGWIEFRVQISPMSAPIDKLAATFNSLLEFVRTQPDLEISLVRSSE